MKNLPHQIVVRVSDELFAALQEDAEHYGRTVAQSARHAMTRHLGVPRFVPSKEGPWTTNVFGDAPICFMCKYDKPFHADDCPSGQ